MGIEYFIANRRNKTIFELGKGIWIDIMNATWENLPTFLYRESFREYCLNYLQEDTWSRSGLTEEEKAEWHQADLRLIDNLFDFIDGADPEKDLLFANDCDDSLCDLWKEGYLLIGSRYTRIFDYHDYLMNWNKRRSKSTLDFSKLDFNFPIKRIRNLLTFA